MNFKFILYSLAMVFTYIHGAFGFLIKGELTPAFLAKNPTTEFTLELQDYAENYEMGKFSKQVFMCKVVEGTFTFNIEPKGLYCYISLGGLRNGTKLMMKEACLVQSASSVNLIVDTSGMRFTGKEADILMCQYNIYNTPVERTDVDSKSDRYFFHLQQYLVDKNKSVKTIMASYRDRLASEVYHIIEQNFFSKNLFDFCIPAFYAAGKTKNKGEMLESINRLKQSHSLGTSCFVARNSFMLPRAIFQLYKLSLFVEKDITPKDKKFSSILFDVLRTNYKGELRNRILITYFFEYRYLVGLEELDNALAVLSNQKAIKILEKYKKAAASGQKAYHFGLTGLDGDLMHLKDFEGKVLVMHFWFNGCGGCSILKNQMEPVIERFKDNSDVCFVAVNVDKSKDRWVQGIKQGIYTSENDVNVFTNGRGFEHPLLKHYNFTSFPSMLLIDKKGNLISSNPPRPGDEKQTKEFIRLIESSL